MSKEKNNHIDRIVNIKGLAWMLNTHSGTSSVCSTNSSHIDQQFKIFKLKDQKKKWKKKINKKFQTVGDQIQAIIRHQYSHKQPFDINYKKQPDIKYTPHLRQIKSVILPCSPFGQQSKSFIIDRQRNTYEQKQTKKSFSQKQNKMISKNSSTSMFYDKNEQDKKIFELKKVFGQIRNENNKVVKSKNILKLHEKQKQFIDRHNKEFFNRQLQWIDNKVDFYNNFDIEEYQRALIKQKMIQKKPIH